MEGRSPAAIAVSEAYEQFARRELAGFSAAYERICLAVAADDELLDRLSTLPVPKRQPNLLLGAVRWLDGPIGGYEPFREFVLGRWELVEEVVLRRRTQTNEANRCAAVLPLLARVHAETGKPLALIEVGTSAGLCLLPDRYGYRYGDRRVGDPAALVQLACDVQGPVPVPAAVPPIAWRAGIDINPLDVTDPGDMRWLECLVWPEQTDRRERLRAAVSIARLDPPRIVSGDLNETIEKLVEEAPADATTVVFHTAVLAYLDEEGRAAFARKMASLPVRWIANESPQTFPEIAARVTAPPPPGPYLTVLALDGRPYAYGAPHGQSLYWL
ncbi:DUF2332 domain-containing protein [Hamadaea tsunoensis]|uniref:DUF2332 domain-containing protein n=1 Tax=Hamadaea tsunoensis TaxID=53368 RepID=UPI00040E6497|nr:DUF2332 domain-containing protein [Hamadaea tsunoensis]